MTSDLADVFASFEGAEDVLLFGIGLRVARDIRLAAAEFFPDAMSNLIAGDLSDEADEFVRPRGCHCSGV